MKKIMTVTEFITEHDGNTAHDDLIEDLSVVTYKAMIEEATTMKSVMDMDEMADSKNKMADTEMSTMKTMDGNVETTTMEYSMDETTKVGFSMQASSFILQYFKL